MHSSQKHLMARALGRACAVAAAACILGVGSRAFAHGVVVDGAATEWSTRAPTGANLGLVVRDAAEQGEYVWLDAARDTRTDLVSPETGADLQSFAVTADATNLYFRVTLGAESGVVSMPVQLQIAIDLDRAAGSGNTALAGFADTDVAPEAAWERLVQTRGGPGGTVRVLDTTYAVVGMGTIATNATTNVTEIAIPWARLPAGRTFDVLRFTVAVFRENGVGDTADIMGSSDALDALTDYGDPAPIMGMPTNTWIEVMDGVVNHSVDVWLDRTSREVYAPLQIVRFLSDSPTPTSEWVEVRNQTPVSLDLSHFALGDEETPDGTEAMFSFPAGSTLAAGAVAIAAEDAPQFLVSYGVDADYEIVSMSSVPSMVQMTVWDSSGASFALSNLGDELLVLGWNRTMVDIVTYGTGAYAGITPRSAPGAARIAAREPVTQDTDDCRVDFPGNYDDCGTGTAGTCTLCRACTRFACAITAGAACDDGSACTTGTTCSATATCTGGSMVMCSDSNPCTTDSCVPATGCSFVINSGALCDDGNACTGPDTCSATGTCGGPGTCDAFAPTDGGMPDAFVRPDAFVPRDAFVAPDAFAPRDAFVAPMLDAFVAPTRDAFVPPMPDAFVAPMPDAFVPGDDAAVAPTDDAAVAPGDDAAVSPTEDAGVVPTDDTGVPSTEDAGASPTDDAAVPPGVDGGARDGGPMDGGRRDGGAGADAGSGLPPTTAGCSCAVIGAADGTRGMGLGALAVFGLALIARRRRARRTH